ncbi:MAG: DMT family transporter [Desulfobacterales bacterium]|nr:DMT family transporter [Desulfobacterales bacterium]
MLASAFLFSVLDGLIKLSGPGFRVWDIAFYRFGIGLVILTGFLGTRRNPFKTPDLKLMIIRGLTGTSAFLLIVTAIRLIPISTAMVLFFTFPAFAALFAFLLFGEKISFGQIGCVVGALIGAAILFDYQLSENLWGQAAGLASGVFAGVTVCLIKKLRDTNGAPVIYLYFCLLGAVITFPAFISNPRLPTSGIDWLMIGGIALSALAAQLLMNQGFKYCKSWEGGLILTSEVVFTSVLGILFLGEIFSWRFGCGALLIVASAVFSHLTKDRSLGVYPEHPSRRWSFR